MKIFVKRYTQKTVGVENCYVIHLNNDRIFIIKITSCLLLEWIRNGDTHLEHTHMPETEL